MIEEEPKRLTNAELMQRSVATEKKKTGDKSYERKQLKAYLAICPIFGMATKDFKSRWFDLEYPGKEIVACLQEICQGEGLSRVRVYPGQVQGIAALLSPTFHESPLWKYFLKVWQECQGLPVIPFYVKGVPDPYILTNDGGKGNNKTAVLYPRIRIPAGGQSNDIYVYSLDLYKKENNHE